MSYSTKQYRGFFYIVSEAGDPMPSTVGPYRLESEAQRVAVELNAKLPQKQPQQ